MNLSWSVLVLALMGAEDQQPSKPKTPNSAFTVEIKISGPQPPQPQSVCKVAADATQEPAADTKLKDLCANRCVAEVLDEIRTAGLAKQAKALVAKQIRTFPESAPSPGSSLPIQLPKVAAQRPRTVNDPEAQEAWPMTCHDAIRIALDNSEIVRVFAFGAQPCPTNDSPIVIAQLNAGTSPWRFKAEVMAEVRSVEQAYWNLAQAHVQLWAADRAVSLAQEILKREQAELLVGRGTVADVAEAEQRLQQFNLDLVTRTSDVITTEHQLRNLLGMPPADKGRIIPVSHPTQEQRKFDWDTCFQEMSEQQPDIVQKKLAMGCPHPMMVERGSAPQNQVVPTSSWGDIDKIQQQNQLEQVIHQATHTLARMYLEVEAGYKQYQTAQRLRQAAAQRLDAQRAYYEEGRITIDRFLDAISQYATATSNESQYLSTYNIALAALSEAKGTLLADRNIHLEERPRRSKSWHATKAKEDGQAKTASFEPEKSQAAELPRTVAIPKLHAAVEAKTTCCDTKTETTGTAAKTEAPAKPKTWSFSISIGGSKAFQIEGTITAAARPAE